MMVVRHIFVNSLRLFCLLMVIYEIYVGTKKYLSIPIASNIFSTEVEFPYISICQRFFHYRMATVQGILILFHTINENLYWLSDIELFDV